MFVKAGILIIFALTTGYATDNLEVSVICMSNSHMQKICMQTSKFALGTQCTYKVVVHGVTVRYSSILVEKRNVRPCTYECYQSVGYGYGHGLGCV